MGAGHERKYGPAAGGKAFSCDEGGCRKKRKDTGDPVPSRNGASGGAGRGVWQSGSEQISCVGWAARGVSGGHVSDGRGFGMKKTKH